MMGGNPFTLIECHPCCGGEVHFLSHQSQELGLPARVSIFLPAKALAGDRVPAIHVLAGLTCTQETFLIKSNAIRHAADHGLALVAPDTSPRGADVAGEDDAYDLGTGAGYYVDATTDPWATHYRMGSYVRRELPALVEEHFPIMAGRRGIMGHSMGGMGALAVALGDAGVWQTVSAFAPISSPSQVDWGHKVTDAYFGGHEAEWAQYDPCLLLEAGMTHPGTLLVDQGLDDEFLSRLQPERLEQAAKAAGQSLTLRRHEGYDHSYWFVQSFIQDHLKHHAEGLL